MEISERNLYNNDEIGVIINSKGRQDNGLSAEHARDIATERIDPAFTLLM